MTTLTESVFKKGPFRAAPVRKRTIRTATVMEQTIRTPSASAGSIRARSGSDGSFPGERVLPDGQVAQVHVAIHVNVEEAPPAQLRLRGRAE